MMRSIPFLLLLFVSLSVRAQPVPPKPEYEVVRQDAKVTLYERWSDFPGTTTKARELKIVFSASASHEKMMKMITEEAKLREWQKNLEEFKSYPKSDSAWHVYTWYTMPWPLTDQDYYSKYKITERTSNRVVITFEPAVNEKLVPVREKINRMKAYGKWVLEKTTTGRTKVTYFITGEPVNIPRSVTDNIVRNNFLSTLNMLIEVAETK